MSLQGTTAAQSLAGIANAERAQSREIQREKRDEKRTRRREDEVQLSGGAETAEAVRNLKDPTQEEAKEDRDAKADQQPRAKARRLDVQG